MTSAARLHDPLLQPLKIRHLELKNRIMSTSHAAGLGSNDLPMERYQRYHEEKAIGGIGLSMFGGSSIISADCSNTFSQLDVSTDAIIPHFQQFSARMHKHGAALMCQITHMGRRGSPYSSHWVSTVGPSRVRETLHRSIPREMTQRDIDRIVGDYGRAAKRCQEGGLDGIETLAGGHLIGQFLSPISNLRSDGYGGSIQNRVRFALEVHREIRRQVGTHFIVGMRYAIDEAMAGGLSFSDAVLAAKILEASGDIDFFNVVYGRMDNAMTLATDNMPTMFMPSAPWLSAAAAFKREVHLPIFHAAKIADLATARYAISEGLLDLVGMTRAHIADPHIVAKLMRGEEDRIRPCVGASFCRAHQVACIHNPSTGRENWIAHEVEPIADRANAANAGNSAIQAKARRVVVVGGGVAGLEAARVARLRGHDVALYEAAPQLGGQVLLAKMGSWRKDLIGVVDWRIAELARLGAQAHTDHYMDRDSVLATEPDVVIMATGGMPDLSALEGHALCLSTFDALTVGLPSETTTKGGEPRHVLVVDGTGRHNACIAAERYAQAGFRVTVATLDRALGAELGGRGDELGWTRRFLELGIALHHDLQLRAVQRDSSGLLASFTNELSGQPILLTADIVIVENGMSPIDDLFNELAPQSINGGETDLEKLLAGQPQHWSASQDETARSYELYRIGDAESSRDIHAAIYDAFRLCRLL